MLGSWAMAVSERPNFRDVLIFCSHMYNVLGVM